MELAITNSSFRRTQQLEIFDNVPHEMKLRSGLNYMRVNLGPGETTRIRYVLRCPLRGHYSFSRIGPLSKYIQSIQSRMYIDHRSGLIVFPQVREIEEAMILKSNPKDYTGAMTLRTPGPGSEFYSLREYVPGDPFKIINWKAFARTGVMMVNEKCRDAVTDVFILLDSRDISRIGTVLKNPLEMGTVPLPVWHRTSSNEEILWLWPCMMTRCLTYPLMAVTSSISKSYPALPVWHQKATCHYRAVTNSLAPRFSRGSPVFVISSLEGDGTVPHAIRDLAGRGHRIVILSPSSIDYERLVSRIPRMSYEVVKL